MDTLTLVRLGQIRQQEIAAMAAFDQRQPGTTPGAVSRLGRALLSCGARLVTTTGCATVTIGNGTTITVRSAQCA